MKTCTICHIPKDESNFYRQRAGKGGLLSYCKPCASEKHKKWIVKNRGRVRIRDKKWRSKNRDKIHSRTKRWRAENPDKIRTHQLRKFGITAEIYNRLLTQQAGVCAICLQPEKIAGRCLAVDHLPRSNPTVVRGLLCNGCNTSLGKFQDNPILLRRAAEYVEKYQNK